MEGGDSVDIPVVRDRTSGSFIFTLRRVPVAGIWFHELHGGEVTVAEFLGGGQRAVEFGDFD